MRVLEGAARGEAADQYPGGPEQREGEIEAGATRPAAELVADVAASAARLEATWSATDDEVWRTGRGRFATGTWPVAELPFRRWREVEIHHVDLDLGYGWDDWPEAYVDAELARALAGLPGRLAPGTAVAVEATDSGERWVVPDGAPWVLPEGAAWVLPEGADWVLPEGTVGAVTVRGGRRLLLAWLVGRAGGPGFPSLGPWTG